VRAMDADAGVRVGRLGGTSSRFVTTTGSSPPLLLNGGYCTYAFCTIPLAAILLGSMKASLVAVMIVGSATWHS
jgi:hypothetical protein